MDIYQCLVSWWCHQMETFSALLTICAGNSVVTGEFPAQRPVTRTFDVFFDLHMKNGWVNTSEAGDLRRNLAHYEVTVMVWQKRSRLVWLLSYILCNLHHWLQMIYFIFTPSYVYISFLKEPTDVSDRKIISVAIHCSRKSILAPVPWHI